MTTMHAPAAPARAGLRTTLRAVTIAAALPYLTLKIAWLSGSHVGIPAGSELRTPDGADALFAANALTAGMDACVIVLAFALTRPWGLRLPAWLIAVPLWFATGLLVPIMVGYPASAVAGMFTDTRPETASPDDAFLDPWVFTLVYSGFGIQALALGGLFTLYIRDRWGALLHGRLTALPASVTAPAQRAGAVAAVVILLLPLAIGLSRLAGGTAGLTGSQIAERDAVFYITSTIGVLAALAAGAGALLLGFRPRRFGGTRVFTAVTLAWVGGAAMAAGGGWLLLANAFNGSVVEPEDRMDPLVGLVYAAQMLTGTLILALGAHLFAERAHRPGRPTG
jgi:hypothetical protein